MRVVGQSGSDLLERRERPACFLRLVPHSVRAALFSAGHCHQAAASASVWTGCQRALQQRPRFRVHGGNGCVRYDRNYPTPRVAAGPRGQTHGESSLMPRADQNTRMVSRVRTIKSRASYLFVRAFSSPIEGRCHRRAVVQQTSGKVAGLQICHDGRSG